MKRTGSINLSILRKIPLLRSPLALAIAAASLTACGTGQSGQESVHLALNPADCASKTELSLEQCEVAYKQAQLEAEKTAPRFRNQQDCFDSFGAYNCHRSQSGGFFMPLMMGYMVGSAISGYSRQSVYNPVFSQHDVRNGRYGPVTSSGQQLRSSSNGFYTVSTSATKHQPKSKVMRTVSRGGFGSTASAKSSWGGGKSSGSWGG